MTIRLRYGDKEMSWGMPVSAINLQDILDRMNVQSGREIEFMFSKYDMVDLPANILDKWYKAQCIRRTLSAARGSSESRLQGCAYEKSRQQH